MGEKHKQAVERQFARAVEHCGGYLARDGPKVIAEKVEFVEPRSSEVALDVACGSGTFALALALRLGRVYGVGLTLEMLGEARKALKQPDTKAAGKVAFYRAEAETLPFADGTFDLVTCGNSFHHFPKPEKMLTEMTRVTKPTGRLGIFDSVAPEEQPDWELYNRVERLRDPSHAESLRPSRFLQIFRNQGLNVETHATRRRARSFRQWMSRGGVEPGDENYKIIKKVLLDGLSDDRTVFAPCQAGQAGDDIIILHQEALFLLRPIVPSVAKLE